MLITTILITLSIISLWFFSWALVLWFRYAPDIKKLILEPMLKHQIIIFESDDWGTGPLKQQEALEKIKNLLSRFCDPEGHHPVMTLGIILAEPDVDKIISTGANTYHKRTLAHIRYTQTLEEIHKGVDQKVFSIHLHGMEHYWPDSIMKSIQNNAQVKKWIFDMNAEKSEDLPSELQSRWVDSHCLPSKNHNKENIIQAIEEEFTLYKNIFGHLPTVVVPPTFVWTDIVEQAYTKRGIKTLITPGRQCIGRNSKGQPQPNGRRFYMGEKNSDDLLFLVRDIYFEPSLGHKAETALQAITDNIKCGRPALLEMHRFNFISGQAHNQSSLQELEKLLQLIKAEFTSTRFISAKQLATLYRGHKEGINSEFIVSSPTLRCKILIARIKLFFKFNRLAKYSGINLLLLLV